MNSPMFGRLFWLILDWKELTACLVQRSSRFIAENVETSLDLDRFYSSYRKVKGQPPYDPRLMVRVLLYGYCVGVRSSRELERACLDVVAFRRLSAADTGFSFYRAVP